MHDLGAKWGTPCKYNKYMDQPEECRFALGKEPGFFQLYQTKFMDANQRMLINVRIARKISANCCLYFGPLTKCIPFIQMIRIMREPKAAANGIIIIPWLCAATTRANMMDWGKKGDQGTAWVKCLIPTNNNVVNSSWKIIGSLQVNLPDTRRHPLIRNAEYPE